MYFLVRDFFIFVKTEVFLPGESFFNFNSLFIFKLCPHSLPLSGPNIVGNYKISRSLFYNNSNNTHCQILSRIYENKIILFFNVTYFLKLNSPTIVNILIHSEISYLQFSEYCILWMRHSTQGKVILSNFFFFARTFKMSIGCSTMLKLNERTC